MVLSYLACLLVSRKSLEDDTMRGDTMLVYLRYVFWLIETRPVPGNKVKELFIATWIM